MGQNAKILFGLTRVAQILNSNAVYRHFFNLGGTDLLKNAHSIQKN